MTRRFWWLLAGAALLVCGACGDDFVGPCVPDDAGKGCDDGGASPDGGGGSAGKNSGMSGTGGSTNGRDSGQTSSGDGGTPMEDDDAGEMPPAEMDASTAMDAAMPMDGATSNPDDAGQNPGTPADGTQLAPCDVLEENACNDGLGCYARGIGSGYCTKTCEDDEDCASLTDAEYTCSTTFSGGGQGPGGGMGLCRVECEGENDTESCPAPLVCLRVGGQGNGGQGNGGAFRCGYEAEPPGGGEDGTVARFGRCQNTDDCAGDLVCYGIFQGNTEGFCTDTCETNDDCSEDPGSGDIDPTCGTQNLCRFDCSEGGTCPDGMECDSDRCIYPGQ